MRRLLLVVASTALLAAACQGGTGRPQSTPTSQPSTAPTSTAAAGRMPGWPTYHRNGERSGYVRRGPTGRLRHAWTARLDGAVYGEPLVADHLLIVATEENQVYGLDPVTGAARWHTDLGPPQPLSGLPCGNIDPLGVTGTPAYDRSTGLVFVVAEAAGGRHDLFALDAASGALRWRRNLDTQPRRDRLAEQQRSALLVTHGRVITAFGGLFGDCGNYVGYLTSVAVDGRGPIASYAVPTARQGGIWAPPGPVLGPDGDAYVSSGNGAARSGRWDRSDSVTALSPVTLRLRSAFAPDTWPADNASDLDLGSMSPAVVPAVNRIVIAGKRGTVYLLRPPLGGVGSQLARLPGCTAFGGAAVVGRTVLMPCLGEYAIRALTVGPRSLRWAWTRTGVYGSPVIAGHRVYVADRQSGDLVVLSLANGSVRQRLAAGPLPHFPSEVVSGDWVFVPTLDGVTAFKGR